MKRLTEQERFEGVAKSRTFRNICSIFGLREKAVLDIGCGFGQYLRHFGPGSIGVTTASEEVESGKSNGLDIVLGNAERLSTDIGKFQAFWANNLYEHLLSPHAFMMNLKRLSGPESIAIIGVPVVPKIVSLMNLQWWRGALASNHVNFFTHTTLRLTIERAGWRVLKVRPFIFKSRLLDTLIRQIAPHIYVVAKNDPAFKYPPKKVSEWKDSEEHRRLLEITIQDTSDDTL